MATKKTYFEIVLFMFCTVFIQKAYPQVQEFRWAKQMGGTNLDNGNSIVVDDSGYVYTTGFVTGSGDFNPGIDIYYIGSGGSYDQNIFVSKLDSNGNFVWAKSMGGHDLSNGNSIALDNSGNVYTTGFFCGTADFNPAGTVQQTYNLTAQSADVFISKLDMNGNFVWAKQIGGSGIDQGNSIALDSVGNIYITGRFNGTVDFDPGSGTFIMTSSGVDDIFVCKLDSNGNFIWAKQMGGVNWDIGQSIFIDKNENLYITGIFYGTADFNPGTEIFTLTSAGDQDVFVCKLDIDGNFIWAKEIGGSDIDYIYSLSLDDLGNIYLAGFFKGTADFNPGPDVFNLTSAGNYDIFITKLDSNGSFIWAKRIGGTGDDRARSIVTDSVGNNYLTGVFYGEVDFDPNSSIYNLHAFQTSNIFVNKLDPDGNYIWAGQMIGTSYSSGYAVALDKHKNIYTTGSFSNQVDFNFGIDTFYLTSFQPDADNIFVHKMKDCSTHSIIFPAACNSFTSPSGNHTWTSSGIYTDIIQNNYGNDSIITIILTLDTVDISVTDMSPIFTANAIGASYQWVNCDDGYSIINGATNQSYTVPDNGNYAVIVTQNSCIDTSGCVSASIIGVNRENILQEINIAPNPTSWELTIQGNNIVYVEIYGYNGNMITKTNQNKIDLSQQAKGIYFVKLITNDKIKIVKLLLE